MTKTIFITGASTGLGRATALLFAAKGWKVIATMRNPAKETELDKLAEAESARRLGIVNRGATRAGRRWDKRPRLNPPRKLRCSDA